MAELDIERLRSWIGREERAQDLVTARAVREMRATLDREPGDPRPGDEAPLAAHWCLAPPGAPLSALGPDGHPARGGFLPPVPLPRRMWAGGALDFHDALRVGDAVERCSAIADVSIKAGRTGTLCFVTVTHRYSTARGPALTERQDIVYRDTEAAAARQGEAEPPRVPEHRETVEASPVLLFRYSALTFNGHRIHYDRDYCIRQEGYPGLVVHGPLQATLLCELAGRLLGARPAHFSFRSMRPVFDGGLMSLNAVARGDGLDLWTADSADRPCMSAQALRAAP